MSNFEAIKINWEENDVVLVSWFVQCVSASIERGFIFLVDCHCHWVVYYLFFFFIALHFIWMHLMSPRVRLEHSYHLILFDKKKKKAFRKIAKTGKFSSIIILFVLTWNSIEFTIYDVSWQPCYCLLEHQKCKFYLNTI